jgi:hypothetical protein
MNDFSQDFFQNLEPALLEAIRQTKNTVQKKAYMLDIPSLINELGTELREGTYQPSRFSCFVVKEPKIREIFAPHYRDRVVHHILVDRVEPFIDKRFIFDSFANRKSQIEDFLRTRLKLELHPRKIILQQSAKGINFLGCVVRKEYVLARQRTIKAFKRRLYFFNHLLDPKRFPIADPPQTLTLGKQYRNQELSSPIEVSPILLAKMLAVINSYYGILRFANTYTLRKSLYENHFHGLKGFFEPKDKWFESIKIRGEVLYKTENFNRMIFDIPLFQ